MISFKDYFYSLRPKMPVYAIKTVSKDINTAYGSSVIRVRYELTGYTEFGTDFNTTPKREV